MSSKTAQAEPLPLQAVVDHISCHRAGVAGIYNRAAYSTAKRAALEQWAATAHRIVDNTTAGVDRPQTSDQL